MAIEPGELHPILGLAINPGQGGPIQNSGALDTGIVLQYPSTVANAEGTVPLGIIGLGSVDGIIDISMCSNIALFVGFTLGSLTSMDLIPEFGHKQGDVTQFHKRGWPSVAAGVVTVTPLIYRFTASYAGVLSIYNPGANYMRLRTLSVGVITSSALQITVGRGCAGMGNILAG